MWKFCGWMLAAIGLWIGGLLIVPPHREIRMIEDGRPVIRATMSSPGAVSWAMWALAAAAASRAFGCGVRSGNRRAGATGSDT